MMLRACPRCGYLLVLMPSGWQHRNYWGLVPACRYMQPQEKTT